MRTRARDPVLIRFSDASGPDRGSALTTAAMPASPSPLVLPRSSVRSRSQHATACASIGASASPQYDQLSHDLDPHPPAQTAAPGLGAAMLVPEPGTPAFQVIPPIGAEGLDRRGPAGSCRLFLGPGFRLAARWNRLVETVKTRKKREKTGKKWARYGLKGVKEGS